MIKAVIFDLDGTLLYTLEDLKDSTNFALQKYGYEELSLNDVCSFVGNGVGRLIELALPNGKNNINYKNCLETMKKHYSSRNYPKTKPYPQIIDLLKNLKNRNIKIAILSNKFDLAVKELCKRYFNKLYDEAIGESSFCKKKPCPEGLLNIIKIFNCQKDEIIYVGDSEVDIKTAQNANVKCICVTWGYRNQKFLEQNGGKNFINKPTELLRML